MLGISTLSPQLCLVACCSALDMRCLGLQTRADAAMPSIIMSYTTNTINLSPVGHCLDGYELCHTADCSLSSSCCRNSLERAHADALLSCGVWSVQLPLLHFRPAKMSCVCCVCQQALGLCGCGVFQGVDGLETQLTDGTSSSCIAAAFPRLCNGLLALAADSQVEQLLLLGYFPWL